MSGSTRRWLIRACLVAVLLLGSVAESAAEEPGVYFRDASGTVYMVSSRSELPERVRATAERIEIGAAPASRLRTVGRQQEPDQQEITFYYASWCGWCRKTQAHLDARKVEYTLRNVDEPTVRRELHAKTGSTSVPVVEVDGMLIRGYDPSKLDRYIRSR